jgi:hypothetical protein
MRKPAVFVSYSHKDEKWKNLLVGHFGVLAKQGILDFWDDRRINAGDDWYKEIQNAMDAAKQEKQGIAILLCQSHVAGESVQRPG